MAKPAREIRRTARVESMSPRSLMARLAALQEEYAAELRRRGGAPDLAMAPQPQDEDGPNQR